MVSGLAYTDFSTHILHLSTHALHTGIVGNRISICVCVLLLVKQANYVLYTIFGL